MTLLILMQRPKQEGLGAAFGSGVTDQVFGARTTNVLQRGTVYLASMFFILALALAVLIGQQNKKTSMLAPAKPAAKTEEKAAAEPQEETQPKSLAEELPTEEAPATETPVTENAPPAVDTKPADAGETETPTPSEATQPAEPAAEDAPATDSPGTSKEESSEP
jgi:preprotein translocase subunit SecG